RLAEMASQTGNWPAMQRFDDAVRDLWEIARKVPDTLPQAAVLRADAAILLVTEDIDTLDLLLDRLAAASRPLPVLGPKLDTVRQRIQVAKTERFPGKNWIPVFHWYGFDNQYHHWLSGFVTGNLGLTRRTQKAVLREIEPALYSSMVI